MKKKILRKIVFSLLEKDEKSNENTKFKKKLGEKQKKLDYFEK